MAYDSGRSVLVLFGGTPDAGDYPADTWEFDGTTWTEVAPTVSPSGRSGAAMAYDRTRGVVVLFGGVGADGTLADTWEYDGTNWREIVTTVSPTGRRECMMTCDVDRGVVVLFGGIGAEGMLADTWEYDGTDWSEISPTTSPPARTDGAMVYDEARSVVMLLGGRGAHDLNDAWEYDGTTWSPVGVPVDESPGRRGAAMAYDSSRGVIVLFGGSHFGGSGELFYGDTWEYDGAAWTQVATSREPPARCHHAMWFDPTRSAVVILGGEASYQTRDDSWTYDGTTWTRTVSQSSPFSRREGPGLAYDSARSVAVLFGGTYNAGELPTDTWEYDGLNWVEVLPPVSPDGRLEAGMVYDAARGVVLLVGGCLGYSSVSFSCVRSRDAWEYDGTTWTPGATPPDQPSFAMTYDSARGVVVLFGGIDGAGDRSAGTWQYDGTNWTLVTPATSPQARCCSTMAYDSSRGVVVLFGGRYLHSYETVYFGDTWEFDGIAWTEVSPLASPPARSEAAMSFDSARGVVVLFGGRGVEGALPDTWEYEGTTWTNVETPTAPSARSGAGMTYDTSRAVVVLFGGDVGDRSVWEYYGP